MTRDEADSRLRQVIIDHAGAYDMDTNGDLLNDYAVVAHWRPIETDGTSAYTKHFSTPSVAHHIAVGLFLTGLDQVKEECRGEG